MSGEPNIADIARGLSKGQRAAMLEFPMIRPEDPARYRAAVTFGSLWRKLSKHWDRLLELQELGIVEWRVSRGETLWRPTREIGLDVRRYLQENPHAE